MSLPPRVFQQVWSTHEDNSVYLIYSLPSRIIIHICFFHAKDVNESNTGAAKCHAGNREQLFLIHWMFKSIDSQVSPSVTDATILRCSVTVSGTCLSNHKLHGVTDRLDKYHHPFPSIPTSQYAQMFLHVLCSSCLGCSASTTALVACLAQRLCSALKVAGRLCIGSETEGIPAVKMN